MIEILLIATTEDKRLQPNREGSSCVVPHQQINKLQHTLGPISTHTHHDALLCPLTGGSHIHKPMMADTVQVILPQASIAWKLQEKLVGQGRFIPGIVQGGVGPQQVVLLCTALLPVCLGPQG